MRGSSTRLPSSMPSFINAMTYRERSCTEENTDPAGHPDALSPAGRGIITLPPRSSCPCDIGYVMATIGRSVVRVMAHGAKTRSFIASAYGLPLNTSTRYPAIQYPGFEYE